MRSFEEWWPKQIGHSVTSHEIGLMRQSWTHCAAEYQAEIERLKNEVLAVAEDYPHFAIAWESYLSNRRTEAARRKTI